jgi:hypothetical protein
MVELAIIWALLTKITALRNSYKFDLCESKNAWTTAFQLFKSLQIILKIINRLTSEVQKYSKIYSRYGMSRCFRGASCSSLASESVTFCGRQKKCFDCILHWHIHQEQWFIHVPHAAKLMWKLCLSHVNRKNASSRRCHFVCQNWLYWLL